VGFRHHWVPFLISGLLYKFGVWSQGCLGEVLDAIARPLHFLSLRGCDLNVDDLEALAKSKHAPELLELNLSKAIVSTVRQEKKLMAPKLSFFQLSNL
jgi:hypothetical protein